MTARQFWASTGLSTVICVAVVGTVLKATIWRSPALPPPAPIPAPNPLPAPLPDVQAATLAEQKARLKLGDGRTATFRFALSGGTLTCTAAIGLDQVLSYELLPVGDPPPPDPAPVPSPNPPPGPNPPTPTPQAASSLRVLFLYDPTTLIDMPPDRQAILASPELRAYLDRHCPMESGCAAGVCPLTAGKTPSYRFLPTHADVSRLSPVWQQTYRATAAKAAPWVLATNTAGQTVIDQAWPASVDETLNLLKTFGGQ
jgi:hypothetical protein